MKLLRFLTEEEYIKLLELSNNSLLISDNKHNYYHADTQYGLNPLGKNPDVIWINSVLGQIIEDFVSFSNFLKDDTNRIRFQYHWSPSFTGVGYINIEELKNGFKSKVKSE